MTKTQFVAFLAHKANVEWRQAERVLNAFLDSLEDGLFKDRHVALRGVGVLRVVSRAAREGRDPRDGASVQIPACDTVVFRMGKDLKDRLN